MDRKRKTKLSVSWWLTVIQALLVRYVKVRSDWVDKVKAASRRGRVVFVLRNRNPIDFLCLRGLCRQHGLPEVGFVSGLSPIWYSPIWTWPYLLLRKNNHEKRLERLEAALRSGSSVVVFLRRPSVRKPIGSRPVAVDGIRLISEVDERLKTPMAALPTVFLWGEHAMKRLPKTLDFVFGSNEYPRLLRYLWLLIRRRSIHDVIAGEPIFLDTLRNDRNMDTTRVTEAVKAGVGRQIETIRRERLGALTKPSSRIKDQVLTSPRLRRELETIAAEENIPKNEIDKRAHMIINKMAADFKPRVLAFFAVIMAFVWRRIYTGMDVEQEDLRRIKETVAKGATLILPTHKSHIDYLVVSQVMLDANIMLPHIAAGQNLSFWPLGWLFRSSGAFFIRRMFINDRFYTAIVNAYVRRLIFEGYVLEIFIEGGRSRTGKLLQPKLGMLEMALKSLAMSNGVDIQILPTFIGYEQVIEEGSYVRESLGQKKKNESIAGLIGSTKVLIKRYGRLYVRTGEPFSVAQILSKLGYSVNDLRQSSARRETAQEIAIRNVQEINRIAIATPSAVLATVLLGQGRKRISYDRLEAQSFWLMRLLIASGATLSRSLCQWEQGDGRRGKDFYAKSLKAFLGAGKVSVENKRKAATYAIREGRRMALDYYKNNIIHFVVPAALVAGACLTRGGRNVSRAQTLRDLELASRLYHWEFLLNAHPARDGEKHSQEAEKLLERGSKVLVEMGILSASGSSLDLRDEESALFLADMIRNYHEAYLTAITAAKEKVIDGAKGDTARRARIIGEQLLSQGRLHKPEGMSRLNIQSAVLALKELRLVRPPSGEAPFAGGEIGDRIITYLESLVALPAPSHKALSIPGGSESSSSRRAVGEK